MRPTGCYKLKNMFLRRYRRIFRFSGDMCGGKTPCKRKTVYSAVFQGHWGGIGGDRAQSKILDFCERHSRGGAWRFFDTLKII